MNDILTRFYKTQDRINFSAVTAKLEGDTIAFRMCRGFSHIAIVVIALIFCSLSVMAWHAFSDMPGSTGDVSASAFTLFAGVCVYRSLTLVRKKPYFGINSASSEVVIYEGWGKGDWGRREVAQRLPLEKVALFVGVNTTQGDGMHSAVYCIDSDHIIHQLTPSLVAVPLGPTLFTSGCVCNKTALDVVDPPADLFASPILLKEKSTADIISMGMVLFDPNQETTSNPGDTACPKA